MEEISLDMSKKKHIDTHRLNLKIVSVSLLEHWKFYLSPFGRSNSQRNGHLNIIYWLLTECLAYDFRQQAIKAIKASKASISSSKREVCAIIN